MRNRLALAVGLLATCLLGVALGAPAKAEEPKKWEFTLLAPAADAAPVLADEMTCPEAGDLDGTFYKFLELGADFKSFKVSGPAHLVNEPNPVGVHAINDYDIDLTVLDAKCNDITPSKAAPDAGTEVFETKRPARFALITYWSGVYPELPVTLLTANSKIK